LLVELVADAKGGRMADLEDGIFFTIGCWDERDGITKLGGGETSKFIPELVEGTIAGDELKFDKVLVMLCAFNGVESPRKSMLG
jgi:hypothetical protein